MPEHNRLAGNCVHQSARATDDQVCRVPDCLDANPIEPSGIPDKLPATSDVVQRARQALDAWPGEPITDDDRKVNAVIGSITVAQYDLVTDLLGLVEVALPTVTAQRDDALAEVERVKAQAEAWASEPCIGGYRIPDGNDSDSQCLHCAADIILCALDREEQ